MRPNRKPTVKQQKALANLVENGGNVSKAMRDAGYSAAMVKNPQKLTQSQAFQYLMEQSGITDEKLTTVLKEGLDATKAVVMGKESTESFVDVQPDYQMRHKYLETALKLKGHGNNQDVGTTNYNFINVQKNDKEEFGL
jgi:hypothetical protein